MTPGEWARLADLPDPAGVAGSFAGVSNGVLLVGGGANFPEKKPWEGGRKLWYDRVYALERPEAQWKPAGQLPRPLGYGVSVTYRDALICVGGSDAQRHYADAFRMEWKQLKPSISPLPALPKSIANACGVLIGDHLYIAGGQEAPDSTTALDTLFEIDLSAEKPSWRNCDPCPGGGRILAVAAALDGDLYVVSGAALFAGDDGKVARRYRTDSWRYRPSHGWTRMPDLPHAVVAAPSPAPADTGGFLIFGGDDGSQVGMTPPQGHHGFSKQILRFDVSAGMWGNIGELPAARVTTPCVLWNGTWVIPSGEEFPGIRSPQAWGYSSKGKP